MTANIVSKRQAAAEPTFAEAASTSRGWLAGRSVAAGHDGPAGSVPCFGGHLPSLLVRVAVVADRRNRSAIGIATVMNASCRVRRFILGRIASSPNRSQDSRHGSIAVVVGLAAAGLG